MVFKEYFLQTINCLSVIKATKKKKKEVAFDMLLGLSSGPAVKVGKTKVLIQHVVRALQTFVHCYHGAQGLAGIGWVS